MEFSRATIQDAEAIMALINTSFREAESFFIDGDRIDAESVRALMAKGEFLVSRENGALRGCVYLERRGDRAYLGLLAVEPTFQNAGLGSALLRAAEERCIKSGCQFMDLRIVNLRTENHAFYRRRGYVEIGTEPFPAELHPKRPCHFVNMSKTLG